jgi:hypothetical protein
MPIYKLERAQLILLEVQIFYIRINVFQSPQIYCFQKKPGEKLDISLVIRLTMI